MKFCFFVCGVYLFLLTDAYEEIQDIDIEESTDRDSFDVKAHHILYRDKNHDYGKAFGEVLYENDTNTLVLSCSFFKPISELIPPFKTRIDDAKRLITRCSLPAKPIAEMLQSLNIDPSPIRMVTFEHLVNPLPPANYTDGLSLRTFWMFGLPSSKTDIFMHNPDILKPLSNLTTLILWSAKVPPLPDNVHLEKLSLQYYAWLDRWEKCEHLKELKIIQGKQIPHEWPANCTRLTSVKLIFLPTEEAEKFISGGLSAGCKNLHTFYLRMCYVANLPLEILRVAKGLKYLDLAKNRLVDTSFTEFPVRENLTDLDLSQNLLAGWFLNDLVKRLPMLLNLNLTGNQFTKSFCDFEKRTHFLSTHLTSLESLSLNNMQLEMDCLLDVRFNKLKYLGLALKIDPYRKRNFDTGKPFEVHYTLPRTNSNRLEVDLRGRDVTLFPNFLRGHYVYLSKGNPAAFWESFEKKVYENTNLTLLFSSVNCECNHYWLARALQEFPQQFVTLPGLICENSGNSIYKEHIANTDCVKQWMNGCLVSMKGYYFTEEYNKQRANVECHDFKGIINVHLFETYKIIGLNVSKNQLTTLHNIQFEPRTDYSETMEWIDLRDNILNNFDANEINYLFADPKRRVWLNGNKFLCNCDNATLLDSLHEHRHQIVDFKDLTCLESGLPLHLITSYDVCQVAQRIIIGISSGIIALLLIAALLLWRYRLQLQIYLYSRGLCLSCLREEDIDNNRPYDAFLSFAHGDEQYVMEELLPRLEGEPDLYRICVHYRDWVVGDWIPSQIMRSVQVSKRTIIIFSRNFLSSMWGSLEFRYAVASAAQEGRSRLLVLILDDVLSMDIDSELQGYLSFNTYLRSDDPWFWEKLRFAMPHRKRFPTTKLNPNPNRHEVVMNTIQMNSIH